jgi:tripartite-type tricarboxylate transporter receptor subunit TctC
MGRKSKIKDIADLRKLQRPFVYPSQGTDEDFYTMAVLGDVLGFKVKVVAGYEGNADAARAVIKGDADGHITGWSESRASIRNGDKLPILMVTLKSPDDSKIPMVTEVAPATKRPVVQAMAAILETHRSYMGPPAMDPQAVAAFRAGVNAAMKEPGLAAEAKSNERPIAPMDGTRQQQMIGEIARASASLAPILKAAVKAIQ